MQWCQRHWDKLRAEIKKQGLDTLVPRSGEQAAASFARQITDGEATVDSFDPLMGAMFDVNSFIAMAMDRQNTGSGMLAVIALEGCPVCKVDEAHMPNCADDRHPKPCSVSIDWCFVNAVDDQRKAWEAMRA